MSKWVDLSQHNQKVDFPTIKRVGIEGVILRDGYGWGNLGKKDTKFDAFYKQADQVGLYINYYHFCYSTDEAGMRQEAAAAIKNIGNKKTGIIFADIELTEHSKMSGRELLNLIKGFRESAQGLGWITGIYMSESMFNKLPELPGIFLWIAHWGGNLQKITEKYHPLFIQQDVIGNSREATIKGQYPGIKGDVDLDEYIIPKEE